MAPRKTPQKPATAKKRSSVKSTGDLPRSMPKGGRDPKGGLTAKGREYFNKKEGSHLRPGVQGPADTPEKMVRKGSFLRRHFTHPRGPMKDDKGQPTRLALSAHAWGEPVPDTVADAKKLADEGHELLEQYHAIKEGRAPAGVRKGAAQKTAKGRAASGSGAPKKTPAKKSVAKKAVAKKAVTKKSAAKKSVARKAAAKQPASRSSSAAQKSSAKRAAARPAAAKKTSSRKTATRARQA